MERAATERRARSVEHDLASGLMYVYVWFQDRVDVFKFTRIEVVGSESGDALLASAKPCYRVQAGACTCEGYQFRGRCRHSAYVAGVEG